MSTDLRYPIGAFEPPSGWTPEVTAAWRDDIARFPATLTMAVEGLDDGQLDTPYRDGGWTLRQVVHHVVDSHLNAYCRFKLALTEDIPTIKPYAEARWAELADGNAGPVEPSLAMLDGLHSRWARLLTSFTEADWHREFRHPDHRLPLTLGRTAAMYVWHGHHHAAHITGLRARENW